MYITDIIFTLFHVSSSRESYAKHSEEQLKRLDLRSLSNGALTNLWLLLV